MAQLAKPRVLTPDEQSCKVFVQSFYDWYWNKPQEHSDTKVRDFREAMTRKPTVLNRQLIRLLRHDDELEKAVGGIANLDFDPYLNSQDPEGKYEVVDVTINGGVCRAQVNQRDIVAEVVKNAGNWEFSNFYYKFYSDDRATKIAPDSDLVTILSQPLLVPSQPIR
ncbi:MAG TPA: hypothetical protein VE291_04835 [Terracidiphilus sp.]|nr:hypothetical protein [Terracidiphilus sp.]